MRNVHQQDFPLLILPQEVEEEDRGLKVCATPRLALASLDDTSQDKNDVFGIALICDELTVELEHNGQTVPALGVNIPLPNQLNAKAFMIDWRLNLQAYGADCYKVKVTYELGGITGFYYAGAYELLPYSVTASEGTTQIIARYGDLVRELGINFTGSAFVTGLRVNGFFGDEQINSEHRNLTKANNTREKVRNFSQPTYNFTTRPISRCHTRPLKQILLNATDLYLSDCNFFNHEVYKFRNVLLSETSGIEMEGEEQRLKVIKCVFVDKIWQTESKYDSQVGQPPNISEIISNFCNFQPVTVNVNGQLVANPTSGDIVNITIQNTDSTPVGVVSGNTITIQDSNINLLSGANYLLNTSVPAGQNLNIQNRRLGQYPLLTGSTSDNTLGESFLTLPFNNPWGNTNRFTWKDGTQVYPNGVAAETDGFVIDNRTWNGTTVLGYAYVQTLRNRQGHIDAAAIAVIDGFSGWQMLNRNQHRELTTEIAVLDSMNFAPFNIPDGTNIGNATLNITNTGSHSAILTAGGWFGFGGVAALRQTLFVREFQVSIDSNNNVTLS